jgi:hypothetical protein
MTVRPEEVLAVVDRIKPLLRGQQPELQGAVLAELLSIWLAGHVVRGDAQATQQLRAELLAKHCSVVRQLTEVNAAVMGTAPV